MNVNAGYECPNCQNGTIEETKDELVCMGECGTIWKKAKCRTPLECFEGRHKKGCPEYKE